MQQLFLGARIALAAAAMLELDLPVGLPVARPSSKCLAIWNVVDRVLIFIIFTVGVFRLDANDQPWSKNLPWVSSLSPSLSLSLCLSFSVFPSLSQ